MKLWKTKTGKEIILLNPAEKGKKAAAELKAGIHFTNDGQVKLDKSGKPIPLTDTQKSWRSGLLSARKDSARCYKAKQNKKNAVQPKTPTEGNQADNKQLTFWNK